MARARTDTREMKADLIADLLKIRAYLIDQGMLAEGAPLEDPWATVETFCSIALAVMAKTNPSKIRSEAMTANIRALLPIPPSEKKALDNGQDPVSL